MYCKFSHLCLIGKGKHTFFERTIMSLRYMLNYDNIYQMKASSFTAGNIGRQGWFYLRHRVCLPRRHKRLILVPLISAALTPFIEHTSFIIAHTISICVRYIQTNWYVLCMSFKSFIIRTLTATKEHNHLLQHSSEILSCRADFILFSVLDCNVWVVSRAIFQSRFPLPPITGRLVGDKASKGKSLF